MSTQLKSFPPSMFPSQQVRAGPLNDTLNTQNNSPEKKEIS